MKNICILLPTKFKTKNIKKYIEKYLYNNEIDNYICIDDFDINFPLKSAETELKLKHNILYTVDNFYNNFNDPKYLIIIISDYNFARLLNKYRIYCYIPNDYIEQHKDITDNLKYKTYDTQDELLQNIEDDFNKYLLTFKYKYDAINVMECYGNYLKGKL
jgi:hypothetical protein